MGNTNTAGMSQSGVKATIRKIADALADPDKEKGDDGLRLFNMADELGEAKRKVFDDMWLTAVGTYGSIDHTHYDDADADGNRRHTPYYLNTLWLTYEEAAYIAAHASSLHLDHAFAGMTLRTNLVTNVASGGGGGGQSAAYAFASCNKLEVARLPVSVSDLSFTFSDCVRLKRIAGPNDDGVVNTGTGIYESTFRGCSSLEEFRFSGVMGKTASLYSCRALSFDSLRFLIGHRHIPNNNVAGNPMTLVLHPDVYAKLTDTADAEAMAILDLAASKNVNIATTA